MEQSFHEARHRGSCLFPPFWELVLITNRLEVGVHNWTHKRTPLASVSLSRFSRPVEKSLRVCQSALFSSHFLLIHSCFLFQVFRKLYFLHFKNAYIYIKYVSNISAHFPSDKPPTMGSFWMWMGGKGNALACGLPSNL